MNIQSQDVNLVNVSFNDLQHITTSKINKSKPKFSKIVHQQLNHKTLLQETEDFSNIIHVTFNQSPDDRMVSTKWQRRQPSYIDYVKKFYQQTKSRTHMRDINQLTVNSQNYQQNGQIENFTNPCDVYFKPDPSRIKKREILNLVDQNVKLCPTNYNKQHFMHLAAIEKQKHPELFYYV